MLEHEDLIGLAKATKLCPGRPDTSAIWRWCRRGVLTRGGERICLEHLRVGGRIYTSAEALRRFFRTVTEGDARHFDQRRRRQPKTTSRTRSDRQRQRDIQRADSRLAAAGIG